MMRTDIVELLQTVCRYSAGIVLVVILPCRIRKNNNNDDVL